MRYFWKKIVKSPQHSPFDSSGWGSVQTPLLLYCCNFSLQSRGSAVKRFIVVEKSVISHFKPVARELFLDRGGGNRERQIDGIFIEFGPCFCPRISVL